MSSMDQQQRVGKPAIWLVAVGVAAAAAVIGVALRAPHRPQGHRPSVYSRSGNGGFMPMEARKPHGPLTPIQKLNADYIAGHYAAVEMEAQHLLEQQGDPDAKRRRAASRAQLLSAYVAAWRKDYDTAAERFTVARHIAASLPDHGAFPAHLGDPEPSLEEEAAFQHAVCVGAEGQHPAAEAEYRDFLRQYPFSILIHAATKRLAHWHHGDVPKDALALWQADMKQQHDRDLGLQRERSLCGPECLAELLRRQGKQTGVHQLAAEMKTDAHGTTLLALAQAAHHHGLAARGLALTQVGLAQQKLPVIACLSTDHYVLVERVDPDGVRIWDPDGKGAGQGAPQEVPQAQWQRMFDGKALGF